MATEPHSPPRWLTGLSRKGKSSFRKLADSVCKSHLSDSHTQQPCAELAFWFGMIAGRTVELPPAGKNGVRQRLDLRSLDSYYAALGEFTLGDLRKIEVTTRRLVERINRLKRTPLVREMYLRGM